MLTCSLCLRLSGMFDSLNNNSLNSLANLVLSKELFQEIAIKPADKRQRKLNKQENLTILHNKYKLQQLYWYFVPKRSVQEVQLRDTFSLCLDDVDNISLLSF